MIFICGILNNDIVNLFTKEKQSHRCRKQTYGYWGKGGAEG